MKDYEPFSVHQTFSRCLPAFSAQWQLWSSNNFITGQKQEKSESELDFIFLTRRDLEMDSVLTQSEAERWDVHVVSLLTVWASDWMKAKYDVMV